MALIILSEALPSPYELTALTIDSYTSLSQLNCLLSSNSCIYHRITQLFKVSLTLSLIRHNIPTSPQHYCHHLILKNVCSAVNGPTYTTSIPMASRIMPPWVLALTFIRTAPHGEWWGCSFARIQGLVSPNIFLKTFYSKMLKNKN